MKSTRNLGIAAIAATISITTIGANPTQAALIKYDFTVDATSGSNPGQYVGNFQYDDDFLTGLGLETIGVENGLRVAFNYLGTNYTEVDDESFDLFPIASFNNGQLLGLSYFVRDQFIIGGDLNTPDVGGNRFYLVNQSVFTTEVGSVTYAKVPEPLTVGGTVIAATLGIWMKRKKKAIVAK
ncbi:PEP-CTERM sorting domain-containing protein [Nostoc sp. PCC 7107]|uniref:PEP-CTERM sorting domain-containing protein n=1 Tax=Nostoc sp. PCC 7107 TaxID=317936 RepID=UPI00029F1C5F|nr:PEP-CTERM sorting domain-containing protein [Nostoc sp. PCC 7107]AFY41893.1 PEP motif putative anchor domain protein [Nostoc sp. PCC 7107]